MPTIGQPGQEASPEASLGRRWQFLDATLQALATTAGLVAWVVLVGGIEAYLRLRAANVPDPTRAVTLLPRNVLIAQGLHVLAAPLVLAVGLALLGLLTATMLARTRWAVYVAPASLAVLAAGGVAFAVTDQVRQYDWLAWVAGVLLFTLGLAFLGLGATSRWPTPATLAMTLAAAVAVWSGTFELVTARIGDPRFETVQLVRDDGSGIRGLLLARSGDGVTLICAGGGLRSLLTVPGSKIRQISFQEGKGLRDYTREELTKDPHDCVPTKSQRLLNPPRETPSPSPSPSPTATNSPSPTATSSPSPTATSSPSPTATSSPRPTKEPTLALPRPEHLNANSRFRVFYPLGHFEEPVSGVVRITTTARFPVRGTSRRLRVATHAFSSPGAADAVVRVGFSSRLRHAMRRRGQLSLQIEITVRNRAGRATIASDEVRAVSP